MDHFITAAIDAGTTGTRTIIFDQQFDVLGKSYVENKSIFLREGWVEQDPIDLLGNVKRTFMNAVESAHLAADMVNVIGITNQRETVIGWDKNTGIPIYNAISWQDTRSQPIINSLKSNHLNNIVREKSGLELSSYFAAGKMKWLYENVIRTRKSGKDVIFGTLDSWLVWNLSPKKEFVTDFSNASRTMLMNLKRLEWDNDLLDIFGIPEEVLPEIGPSFGSDVQKESSLSSRGKIASILGDQQASLFGEQCLSKGDTKATIGTGTFVLQNIGENNGIRNDGLLTTVAFGESRSSCNYALEGSVPISGSIIDWLVRGHFIENRESAIEILKRKMESGEKEDVYFVPSFSGLFSPYWDGSSRGIIIGLTAKTTVDTIVMASYEAMIFQLLDIVRTLYYQPKSIKVDGGPTSNRYLMQMIADYSGMEIEVPFLHETTALGAALAATNGESKFKRLKNTHHFGDKFETFVPSKQKEKLQLRYKRWKLATFKSRGWIETEFIEK